VLANFSIDQSLQSDLIKRANSLPKNQLTHRNTCDFELLVNGAFSPLRYSMGKEDYLNVLHQMRLKNGILFPVPVTLSINPFKDLKPGGDYTLVDLNNNLLAIIKAEEIYEWDRAEEAQLIYGTTDKRHPLVAEMQTWGRFNLAGEMVALNLPKYYDFNAHRLTPFQVREELSL